MESFINLELKEKHKYTNNEKCFFRKKGNYL
jgi:hypothetical protein